MSFYLSKLHVKFLVVESGVSIARSSHPALMVNALVTCDSPNSSRNELDSMIITHRSLCIAGNLNQHFLCMRYGDRFYQDNSP